MTRWREERKKDAGGRASRDDVLDCGFRGLWANWNPMKISEIINNPENRDVTASPPQSLPNDSPTQLITSNISQTTSGTLQGRTREGDPPAMNVNVAPVDNPAAMTGIETSTSLRRGSSFTAPNSSGDAFKLKAPTLLRSQSLSLPLASSDMQSPNELFEQPQTILLSQGNNTATTNISPTALPPVTLQQNARVRLRPDGDASAHLPIKRARRNTADQSAHSQSDHYPDSPNTSSSSEQGQWAGYQSQARPPRPANLPTEQTTILDQSGTTMINDPYIQQWKRDVSRNTSTTSLPHPASSAKGQTSSTGTFILPTQPRDGLSKSNSIYPEATMASISSAGSSAWHSVNGGSSFVSIAPTSATSATSTSDDPLSTPKFAQLPPPPALRRANPPKPLVPIGTNTKVQPPPPSFRRRTTGPPSATASELLDHPQIKAALQKHKELSWRSVQEQVGGSWEPRSELKVMFGEGAPGNLMKRYSASEILDPINWNRSQAQQTSLRGEEASTDPKRVWFQVRPEMKGATDAAGIKDEPNDAEEGRVHKLEIEGDTIMQDAEKAPKERLISASKELMINQLFPKYQPYIPGLPSGAIYLRHDHDRFEFRPYGWGHREDDDEDGAGGYDSRDPQSMALIRTPSGTPGGRFIAPENRRLLQWSLAQARWLFVLNELPTQERPRLPGGYPIPDRLDSFLQQGEVVRRLDFDPNHVRQQSGGGMMTMTMMETPGQWEWVLPIREKLWVSPMDEIVKKCGKIAAPVWDLGGRMLWDEVVGQWKFEISAPTREVRETLTDKDGVGREVMYDVCEGGRPRVSWNDFMGARDYLLILRRKITKLKAKARAQSAVRLPPSEALPPTSLELPKIKKEEDLDSNLSDSGMDQDSSIMSTSSVTGMSSIGEKERQPPVLTDHGQRCASLLINMMMSVGRSPLPPPASNATNKDNAISLDLGPAPAPASASAPLQPGDKLHLNVNLGRNNGFGEIGSASPSLSPTGSHVSAQRSVSVEDVDDDEEGSIAT